MAWCVVWWDIIKEDFRRSFALWERQQTVSVLVGLLISAAFAILSTLGIAQIPGVNLAPFWAMGLVIWFIFLLFVVTPIRSWKELHEKFEKPRIEMVYDDNCRTEIYRPGGYKYPLYLVGVRAIGGHTVENVEVRLKDMNPDPLHVGVVALNPKDSITGSPSTFTVNPSSTPTRYVEVVQWKSDVQEIGIHFHPDYHVKLRHIPSHLPKGKYILTLLATGDNIPECEKRFIAEVGENNELSFRPEA